MVKNESAVKAEESVIKKAESPIKQESLQVIDQWLAEIPVCGGKLDS